MAAKMSKFVRVYKYQILSLKEREAIQAEDCRAYHIPEGGFFQLSAWQINEYSQQGFWQVIGEFSEKEIREWR